MRYILPFTVWLQVGVSKFKMFSRNFSNSWSTNIPPEGVPPLPEAPSDPGWGDFAAWSQCSATCGAGQISRMRLCTPKIEENGFKNFTVCDGYPQECFIFSGNPPPRDFQWMVPLDGKSLRFQIKQWQAISWSGTLFGWTVQRRARYSQRNGAKSQAGFQKKSIIILVLYLCTTKMTVIFDQNDPYRIDLYQSSKWPLFIDFINKRSFFEMTKMTVIKNHNYRSFWLEMIKMVVIQNLIKTVVLQWFQNSSENPK